MKRVVLAIAAVLVLIALPAVAQYSDPSTTTQPSTTTTTDTTATMPSSNLDTSTTTTETPASNVPVQEERTNPAVPTHSPNSGLSASGSVVSWNNDEVVLHTATGITHFKLLPSTTGVNTFTEGQRVTIDFDRNEQGVLLAKQIRLEGTTAPVAQGITTPGAAEAGANVAAAVGVDTTNSSSTTTSTTTTQPTSTESTTTESTTTNLPATGSNAPLAGLIGLLALGGAAALRRL